VQQRGITFTHVLSSDLTRARLTADAIVDAQISEKLTEKVKPERIVLEILREQDFGSLECQPWASKPNAKGQNGKHIAPEHPDFKPKETHQSMATRTDTFLDEIIHPLLAAELEHESTVAVVSHGIILSILWRALLQRLGPRSVSFGPEVSVLKGSKPLEYLPGWSNTGYLELDIKPVPVRPSSDAPPPANIASVISMMSGYQMLIKTVNGKDHLSNLKRTRGGVGSTAFDAKQKNLEGFFKKPKIDGQNHSPG